MFVHLHVHSRYSLLDGLADVKDLVKAAKAAGMPAVALTDHGVLYGLVAFYRAAIQEGVQPILGMEAYFTPDHRVRSKDAPMYHLLLLAISDRGVKNLFHLATKAQLQGFYQKPRIDREWLAQHAEGLVTTTGCMSGEIPRLIQQERLDEAEERLRWFLDLFGRERFFVEFQNHDDVENLERVNGVLYEWTRKYDLKPLATNDVHYLSPEDARRHDILLAIQTGKSLNDPKRMRMGSTYYFRSAEEMAHLFREIPDAVTNTLLVAEMAQDVTLGLNSLRQARGETPVYYLPDFPVPEGETPREMLRRLVEEGLRRRYGPRADSAEVRQRLEEELEVIHRMGFDTYFLIVWDLANFARSRGIWNNARGSAGGSLVAYALGITMVDPLKYGLLFERFLNADRQTMPDIDLDFPDHRRDEVMAYIKEKYGEDRVAQIITFGTMKARAAVRDVGRIMEVPLAEVDALAKSIPQIPSKPVTLKECLEGNPNRDDIPLPVPQLVEARKKSDTLRELLDTAAVLEGVIRNVGTHAAGVVITPRPLTEYLPLHRPTSKDAEEGPIRLVTQFEMSDLEDLGLLKVDCLGLATMTVMQRACELIQQRHGKTYTLETIPTDDPAAYALLSRGETAGVFQVEGEGFTRIIMKMKPTELRHVIAAVALYRPGPMRFIDTFIRRMHGEEPVTYPHPDLEEIYSETYGIPVYQEQIMLAARKLAGFSGPDADHLRRAISKKKKKQIEKYRVKFIEGAVARGLPREQAEEIFRSWEGFAAYGFNKSHAATYAVMVVQTAYLKAHYPLEYMTALLSAYMHDSDKVALYAQDCKRMGIPVWPPDVNASDWEFTIEAGPEGREGIRFGLGGVKNVSRAAVEALVQARKEGGPFQSLGDLIRRVNLRSQVGKRSLESLIKVGALDAFGDRKAMLEALDRILSASDQIHRMQSRGQLSLFGAVQSTQEMQEFHLPQPEKPTPLAEKLAWERELTGLYFSENPLTRYQELLPQLVSHDSRTLARARPRATVIVAGMITEVSPHRTRKGDPMGYITLEDLYGPIALVLFPRTWATYKDRFREGDVVLVEGTLDTYNSGRPKVLVNRMQPLPEPAPQQARQPSGIEVEEEDFVPPAEAGKGAKANGAGAAPFVYEDLREEAPPPDPGLEAVPAAAPARTQEGIYPPLPPWPGGGPAERAATRLPEVAPPARETPQTEGSTRGVSATTAATPPTPTPTRETARGEAPAPAPKPATARRLVVYIEPLGDPDRDRIRLHRLHDWLISFPGRDRFVWVLQLPEGLYQVEFPRHTTHIEPELLKRLEEWGLRYEITSLVAESA